MKASTRSSEWRDMQLDLLVDDELPEAQRATVLGALDAAPEGWRDLAIRFMQRQVERAALRQLMQHEKILPATPAKPRHITAALGHLRMAAAFILTAGLAAGLAVYFSNRTTPELLVKAEPARITVPTGALTPGLSGAESQIDLPVVLNNEFPPDLKSMMPVAGNQEATSRHVVIMPNGASGAVVFPVTTNIKQVVY